MAEHFTFGELAAVLRVDGGDLRWLVTRGNARSGAVAGRLNRRGYIVLQFKGRDLLAHRVIWLLSKGAWPDGQIDHRDGDPSNNSIDNLRVCTNAQNQRNRKSHGDIAFKGVTRHTGTGRFQAQCGQTYLGLFREPVTAAMAYDAAALVRYGDFARLNFPRGAA